MTSLFQNIPATVYPSNLTMHHSSPHSDHMSFLSDLRICQTCFPPQGFALALPSARNTFPSNCHITGCFLLFRSQLRCHLPTEVTIHSIKVALPPPRAACHFSSSYCPGPFSPWLPPLPELISFMYLFTFSLSVFHQ